MSVRTLILLFALLTAALAPVMGCGCGDDDDDSGSSGDDDDSGDDDAGDDDMGDDDSGDDDITPECVDTDGDGYGENCDAGPDCNDGDPAVWQILTGYVDADGDGYAGTGVDLCAGDTLPAEYFPASDDCDDGDATVFPGATEFPDDGVDQDCDGDDATADEADGFFVDTAGGDDGNDGTRANPVATIQKGIDLSAAADGKPDVYIAEGTYTEDAVAAADKVVHLYGGYDPSTWTRGSKAATVLRADTQPDALYLTTGSDAIVQGMTINGRDTADSFGIQGEPLVNLVVADATIRTSDGTGNKIPVYLPTSGTVGLYRSTFIAADSSDAQSFALYVGYAAMNVSDCDFQAGSASSQSTGLYLFYVDAHMTRFTVTVGETNGSSTGFYLTQVGLRADDFEITQADADDTIMGIQSSAGDLFLSRGRIDLGNSATGTLMGLFNTTGSLVTDAVDIHTGDATPIFGVYSSGGLPMNRNVLNNTIVVTGESASDNMGIYATAITTSVGNSVIDIGPGTNRFGVYQGLSGTEIGGISYFNNHIQVGSSSGNAYQLYFTVGVPIPKIRLAADNLYGDSDCLVYDGTDCLTDIADVNDCAFAGCLTSSDNLSVDPEFAGADDYHPAAGSPLIDAGVSPSLFLPTGFEDLAWYDLDGNPRPQGDGWDIGPYEAAP